MSELIHTSEQFSSSPNFDYSGDDINLLEDADNYFNLILDHLEVGIGQNILEVGAGTGNLTKWLRLRYPDANITIVEPSNNMVSQFKSKEIPNINIIQGFLKDNLDKLVDTFDCVIYNNVLEHCEDDQSEIHNSYKVLKDGGYLLSYNPAMQSLYDHHDASVGHYRRYSKSDLVNKYTTANFKINSAYYHDMLGAVLMYVKYKIIRSKNIKKGSAMTYFNNALPVVDKIESIIPVPFGKNLFVIGVK
jgi:trans-aconitate methyltransferase